LKSDTLSGDIALELPEFEDPPADPLALLGVWIDSAQGVVREPLALVLATTDADLNPSSRVVLIKACNEHGIVFTTHDGSRKARNIAETRRAAGTLHWRETVQQVNLAGAVERLPDAASDALFADRPLAAQATTAVSQQGRPSADPAALRCAAEELVARGAPVPRPQGWAGYRLIPDHVEFWLGSKDRLHQRLAYVRSGGHWTSARLQP
jgi:dihydrophenazinedicarboxylate synthase